MLADLPVSNHLFLERDVTQEQLWAGISDSGKIVGIDDRQEFCVTALSEKIAFTYGWPIRSVSSGPLPFRKANEQMPVPLMYRYLEKLDDIEVFVCLGSPQRTTVEKRPG